MSDFGGIQAAPYDNGKTGRSFDLPVALWDCSAENSLVPAGVLLYMELVADLFPALEGSSKLLADVDLSFLGLKHC